MSGKVEIDNRTGIEIAVIGMAGRFPGAKNIGEFWENLKNGIESISFLSDEEISGSEEARRMKSNPNYVNSLGGVLENLEYFDAYFFGYTPIEAEIMDPQIRIFLECSWEVLENSGYTPGYYPGQIGLYAGIANHFSWEALSMISGKGAEMGEFATSLLTDGDFLATTVSYKLGLKGPAVLVQTACSTGLVAIHMACQALLNGECDMALAGAISVDSMKKIGYIYQEGMINSPDGHCRAFDSKAKGCISGSGVGIVMLKLLDEALENRDHIFAVIKGSAVNNDGNRKSGYTAPSVEGQSEAIIAAHQVSEVPSHSITYVETHGTGTELGDPIEIAALKRGFNTDKKHFCAIGSVKPNIGHLNTAAGIAGFIKTVLALIHRLLPPSLNFDTPNPEIDFENSPFFVNKVLREWKTDGYPLRAGVSSFGIGGTNVHVVLEEAPKPGDSSEGRAFQLLLLSAKTKTALDVMSRNLAEYIKNHPGINLADIAFTLNLSRSTFNYKKMLVCSDINETIHALSPREFEKNYTSIVKNENSRVVFVFSGLGSQYVNMGLDLYNTEAVFRNEMDRCFKIIASLSKYDIKDILYPSLDRNTRPSNPQLPIGGSKLSPDSINRFEVAQLIIFIFEYALSRLLMEWGIKPQAMIGYSFGEYIAACIAGVISLEDAIKLVIYRGKLIEQTPGGAMLSVPLTSEEVKSLTLDGVSIAIDNGLSCVVSGSIESIAIFEEKMKQKGKICMRLKASVGIHSAMMEPLLKEFEDRVKEIKLNKPQIPYISNVTGTWISEKDVRNPVYWKRHLRETVLFADGIKELTRKGNVIFVEIGPGRDISAIVARYLENDSGRHVINLVRPSTQPVSDVSYLLNKIGLLWLGGIKIEWSKFYSSEKRYRIPLPSYPFEGQRYWIDGNPFKLAAAIMNQKPQSRLSADMSDWFYIPSWKRLPLYTVPQKKEKNSVKYNWLVFVNDLNMGKIIVDRFAKKGHTVVVVKTGNEFEQKDERVYTINPGESGNYDSLFNELRKSNVLPDRIIHCWGITGENNNPLKIKSFDEQYLGFYSLFYTAKVIGKQNFIKSIEITVLTDHLHEVVGGELLCPAKSTIMGLINSIPQEYPGIRCSNIDILCPEPGTFEEEALIDTLCEELTSGCHEPVVAIRNHNRWVRLFEPLHLGTEVKDYAKLRKKGVYLITGGLGKIGLMLSELLTRRVGARLVLTGRSQFPPKDEFKIKKLQQIEAWGGQVLYIQADASNLEQMQEVILHAEQTFGKIDGIIHCAGILGGPSMRMIQDLTPDDCNLQFQSKAYGAEILEKLFKDKDLDFVWVLSSISSFLGGLGFAAYAAANIFLDTLVRRHNRLEKKRTHWFSLNWDGMEAEESIEIFHRLLSLEKLDQVIFSVGGNLQKRLDQWIKMEQVKEQVSTPVEKENRQKGHPRPYLPIKYIPPQGVVEKKISTIWERILGIDGIGANDDFLELGGDSLKAVNMLAALHKNLEVKVPVAVIFEIRTIRGLSEYIKKMTEEKYAAIEPVEKKKYFLLSSAQKRLYILHEMSPDSIAYNMPEIIHLPAVCDLGKIEETFKKLIKRHESLRTSFHMVIDTPVQVVHDHVEFDLDLRDSQDFHDSQDFIKRFIRPFDLAKAPLIHAGLRKDDLRILIVDMHHIISDGVSLQVLVNDFLSLYAGEELLPLRIQYKDFSKWQNEEKEKENLKRQEDYWLKEFSGEIPVLELPTDYPRPVEQSFEGESISFEITGEEIQGLKAVALKGSSTLFMVLASLVNILFSKLSGQEEIVIGTPMAGRRHSDLEKIIGMFVNTLSLRNYPSGDRSFREFLGDVKERVLKAFENQEYPFEELVDKLSLKRDIGRNPLFDVMFVLQNLDTVSVVRDEETEIKNTRLFQHDSPDEYENIFQTAKFDLTLTVVERGRGLFFSIQYCTKLFKKETVERYIVYFKKIISIALKEPGIKISEIEVISEEEKNRLLYEFNDTEADYPKDKTIHRLFEEQVERTPDLAALVGMDAAWKDRGIEGKKAGKKGRRVKGKKEFDEAGLRAKSQELTTVTYKELNEKSNRLAYVLQSKGVVPDSIVGIMVERSVGMIVGIMGILKAGGAYLPLAPDYPQERIDYMLKESGAKLLVTNNDLEKLPDLLTSQIPNFHLSPATSLAYIIYTSGSTGNPKGVVIDHFSLVNRLNWMQKKYPINNNDTILQKTTFTFDVSVWEILWWSVVGAKVHLLQPGGEKEPEIIISAVERNHVSVMHFVPSMLSVFLDYIDENGYVKRLSSLKQVIASGEALTVSLMQRFNEVLRRKNGTALANLYGPTEASIDVSYYDCPEVKEREIIPIGKPIDNIRLDILDQYLHIQPTGVPGELCISGTGLARGYINHPELTAERFVEHRFYKSYRSYTSYILYKTGDLARWLSDGNIEFLGRIDHQVKIRGFRIELGEIENQLLKHPGIKETVVLAREESIGDKYICAYTVSDSGFEISEVREFLSKVLPDYMIPSYFVRMEKIPLTPNGKVDRKALPGPERAAGESYIAPRDDIEKKLVGLWAEVLNVEEGVISIDSNFFELGGHSLKATILAAKIYKYLDVKLPLALLFKSPTIEKISLYIKGAAVIKYTGVPRTEEKEYYDLTSAQKRFYVLQRLDITNTSFNFSTIWILEEEPDEKRLEESYKKLLERHESLRTSFEEIEGKPVQKIIHGLDAKIKSYQLDAEVEEGEIEQSIARFIENFIRPFDLAQAPLMRVGLIKKENKKPILMIDIHHIIADGLAVQILIDEFFKLYVGEGLPLLKIQYKDFSEWQNSEKEKTGMKSQEDYWLKIFRGNIPVLNLPIDFVRPGVQSFVGDVVDFEIGPEETKFLKSLAEEEKTTLFIVILAICNIWLSKLCNQEAIVIGTGAACRRHPDIQNMLGNFQNMMALLNYPEAEKYFLEFLREVNERTVDAFENQEYPFEELVKKIALKREKGRNPLFDAYFLLQDANVQAGRVRGVEIRDSKMRPYSYRTRRIRFDLGLYGWDRGESLIFTMEYCTGLFKHDTVEGIPGYFKEIICAVKENRNLKLKDIKISHNLFATKDIFTPDEYTDFNF